MRMVTWHVPCIFLGLGTEVFLSFENKGDGAGRVWIRNAEFLELVSTKSWDDHPEFGHVPGFCR